MHLKSVKYDANIQRKSALICNYMQLYVTLYKMCFYFLRKTSLILNKILNILSKTKKMITTTAQLALIRYSEYY
jgi:hypothetical protein